MVLSNQIGRCEVMEHVDPIRDVNKIKAMKRLLKEQSARDYLLFVLGINTGLKITEILELKMNDVINPDGTIKRFLKTPDNKHEIFLNSKVKAALTMYVSTIPPDLNQHLFLSPKTNQPITRQQAYRIINKAAKSVGIDGKIGTHSMRKTFGYHAYKKGVAISLLQKLFHHSTPSETKSYLGIKNEEIKTEIDVNL